MSVAAVLTVDCEIEGGALLLLQVVGGSAVNWTGQVRPEDPSDGQGTGRVRLRTAGHMLAKTRR